MLHIYIMLLVVLASLLASLRTSLTSHYRRLRTRFPSSMTQEHMHLVSQPRSVWLRIFYCLIYNRTFLTRRRRATSFHCYSQSHCVCSLFTRFSRSEPSKERQACSLYKGFLLFFFRSYTKSFTIAEFTTASSGDERNE